MCRNVTPSTSSWSSWDQGWVALATISLQIEAGSLPEGRVTCAPLMFHGNNCLKVICFRKGCDFHEAGLVGIKHWWYSSLRKLPQPEPMTSHPLGPHATGQAMGQTRARSVHLHCGGVGGLSFNTKKQQNHFIKSKIDEIDEIDDWFVLRMWHLLC